MKSADYHWPHEVSMKILTAAEMRAADAATTAEYGIPSMSLMENAGAAVARFVLQELPDAERGDMRIVALCGKGNNGGDGFVAARILAEAGCDVGRAAAGPCRGSEGRCAHGAGAAERCGAGADGSSGRSRSCRTADIAELLDGADLFLDAVLGTGFRPPMRGVAVALGEWLAAHRDDAGGQRGPALRLGRRSAGRCSSRAPIAPMRW